MTRGDMLFYLIAIPLSLIVAAVIAVGSMLINPPNLPGILN